ncbi:MAG: thioredoxin family protein [Planctomycetota bacterium]
MLRIPAALALLAAAAAAQALRVPVKLEEVRTVEAQPFVGFPQRELSLVKEKPAGSPELSKDARYAVVELGGKRMALAFDVPEGALALGLLAVGDRKALLGHARPAQGGLLVDFTDVPSDAVRLDVRLQYEGLNLARAGLQPSRHRRGRTAIGGEQREVILVDAEGDGRYDGEGDRWIALRPERLTEAQALKRADMLRLDEPQVPFEPDGRALMVQKVAPDGSKLELTLDAPRKSREEVLKRRFAEVREDHFERFAQEEASFRARNGMKEHRPRAEALVPWLDGPLSAAKAEAARARKPLLAFFFTESNPWSFRYDYYTLSDREVDELLRRFVLVRIDAEKDPEKGYAAVGARGLPCLVPLTPAGEPVEFRFRMRDDAGEVYDLEQVERMVTGWQAPAELAENLRRILKAAR